MASSGSGTIRPLYGGIRERIVKIEDAPSLPFATGRFALVEEPVPSGDARA